MADFTSSFAQGVETGSNLVSRARAQRLQEQQVAAAERRQALLAPLQMQAMEQDNTLKGLQITQQLQIKDFKLKAEATFTEIADLLGSSEDPAEELPKVLSMLAKSPGTANDARTPLIINSLEKLKNLKEQSALWGARTEAQKDVATIRANAQTNVATARAESANAALAWQKERFGQDIQLRREALESKEAFEERKLQVQEKKLAAQEERWAAMTATEKSKAALNEARLNLETARLEFEKNKKQPRPDLLEIADELSALEEIAKNAPFDQEKEAAANKARILSRLIYKDEKLPPTAQTGKYLAELDERSEDPAVSEMERRKAANIAKSIRTLSTKATNEPAEPVQARNARLLTEWSEKANDPNATEQDRSKAAALHSNLSNLLLKRGMSIKTYVDENGQQVTETEFGGAGTALGPAGKQAQVKGMNARNAIGVIKAFKPMIKTSNTGIEGFVNRGVGMLAGQFPDVFGKVLEDPNLSEAQRFPVAAKELESYVINSMKSDGQIAEAERKSWKAVSPTISVTDNAFVVENKVKQLHKMVLGTYKRNAEYLGEPPPIETLTPMEAVMEFAKPNSRITEEDLMTLFKETPFDEEKPAALQFMNARKATNGR